MLRIPMLLMALSGICGAADTGNTTELGDLGIVGAGKGELRNDRRQGRWVFTHADQIMGTIDYEDGVMNGLWIAFDRGGAVLCAGLYTKGVMVGMWIRRRSSAESFRTIVYPGTAEPPVNKTVLAEHEAILKNCGITSSSPSVVPKP